jgi:putative ABC transport system permease protein
VRSLRALLIRVSGSFAGARRDREFRAELESHLQLHIDDNLRAGMTPEAARRQALMKLGGIAATKELHRDQRRLPFLDTLVRDLRFGLRLLRRNPGFTAVAVSTLAIAIGVNTAVYTIVDHLIVRPLPYPQPDRLAMVVRHIERNGVTDDMISQTGATWIALRDGAPSIDLAVSSGLVGGVNLVAPAGAEYVEQQRVSSGYFRVLGVPPAIGREFTIDEDQPGGPAVAVLSHGLWTRTFAADPGVVGRSVTLRGEPFTVVGVTPAGFVPSSPTDLWTPLRPSTRGEGAGGNYQLIARLRPGATWPLANGQVMAVGATLLTGRFQPPPDVSLTIQLVPLQRGTTAQIRQPLFLLWAAVGMVLLIGCVNVAGLMIVRSAARSSEIATRLALGGGRATITRQLLSESLVLAACGGVFGIALGCLLCYIISGRMSDVLALPILPDGRVLLVTAAGSLLTCLLFGLFPAWQAGGLNVRSMLVDSGSQAIAGPARRWPARALVVMEVALGIVLVVGAGLLIRTLTYLTRLPPGFDATNVIAGTLSLQDARYETSAQVNGLFTRTLDRIRQTPGVEHAAVALTLPFERALNQNWRFDQETNAQHEVISLTYVTPEYFSALRIAILRGRVFTDGDTAISPPVIVVNEAFTRRYSRDTEPVGRRLVLGSAGTALEIIGMVGAIQQKVGFDGYGPVAPMPAAYVPVSQQSDGGFRLVHTWFSPSWIVRGTATSRDIITAMRSALQGVDPQLPFNKFRTLDDVRDQAVIVQRVQAGVLAALAALSMLLAMIGVYGLVASSVGQRTRELGVRMALGATPFQVVRTATAPGIALGAAGVAIGLVLAAAGARVMQRLVFGVSVDDPVTFGVAALVVLLMTCVGALAPAVRILRLNVITALRQ